MYNKKIYDLRKSKNMSQEDLADILNVSRQAVSKWELGTAMPDMNNLISIAKTFNVTIDYIISEKDSDYSYYPMEKKVVNHLPGYKIAAFFVGLFSVLTIVAFVLVSIIKPMTYHFPITGISYSGIRAYYYTYNEVAVTLLLSIILIVISAITLILPEKIWKKNR